MSGAVWPPAPIATPLATGIAQFATEKERQLETRSPAPLTHSDMSHRVPRAMVAVSAKHAAAWEKSKSAAKADNPLLHLQLGSFRESNETPATSQSFWRASIAALSVGYITSCICFRSFRGAEPGCTDFTRSSSRSRFHVYSRMLVNRSSASP